MRVSDAIEDLADTAAAGDDIRRYLRLRGIKTVATLALIANDEDGFSRHVIEPLLAGWRSESETVKISNNAQPIARAILVQMWSLARAAWAQAMVNATPAPTPSPTPTSAGTSSTSAEQKAPKTVAARCVG